MELDASLHDDAANSFNVLGEIPGSEKPDEVVMLGAHLDAWPSGTGAADNAAGVAVVIEAMRILKSINVHPRRTIRLALWGGHEGAGLGSRTYIRSHFDAGFPLDDLADAPAVKPTVAHAKLSAYLNHDHGQGAIRGIFLEGNEAVGRCFGSGLSR